MRVNIYFSILLFFLWLLVDTQIIPTTCNVLHCDQCSMDDYCSSCQDQYYEIQGVCSGCPTNCIDCSSSTSCYSCVNGSQINNLGQCVPFTDTINTEYQNGSSVSIPFIIGLVFIFIALAIIVAVMINIKSNKDSNKESNLKQPFVEIQCGNIDPIHLI